MTFHDFFHDLFKFSMTLGLVITFKNFNNFPSLGVFFDFKQFNRHKLTGVHQNTCRLCCLI